MPQFYPMNNDVDMITFALALLPAFLSPLGPFFLHGPSGGDSATPRRSGGRAPCRNKALPSTSRPKARSGDAWCCWASLFFRSRFLASVSRFVPFPAFVPFRFSSFARFVFRFSEQGWNHCKSSPPLSRLWHWAAAFSAAHVLSTVRVEVRVTGY